MICFRIGIWSNRDTKFNQFDKIRFQKQIYRMLFIIQYRARETGRISMSTNCVKVTSHAHFQMPPYVLVLCSICFLVFCCWAHHFHHVTFNPFCNTCKMTFRCSVQYFCREAANIIKIPCSYQSLWRLIDQLFDGLQHIEKIMV